MSSQSLFQTKLAALFTATSRVASPSSYPTSEEAFFVPGIRHSRHRRLNRPTPGFADPTWEDQTSAEVTTSEPGAFAQPGVIGTGNRQYNL
jgi:hypothetical protein